MAATVSFQSAVPRTPVYLSAGLKGVLPHGTSLELGWELFHIIPCEGHPDLVGIKTAHDTFLSVNPHGDVWLAPHLLSWERFRVQRVGRNRFQLVAVYFSRFICFSDGVVCTKTIHFERTNEETMWKIAGPGSVLVTRCTIPTESVLPAPTAALEPARTTTDAKTTDLDNSKLMALVECPLCACTGVPICCTPCGHLLCVACADKAAQPGKKCPLCRATLGKPGYFRVYC